MKLKVLQPNSLSHGKASYNPKASAYRNGIDASFQNPNSFGFDEFPFLIPNVHPYSITSLLMVNCCVYFTFQLSRIKFRPHAAILLSVPRLTVFCMRPAAAAPISCCLPSAIPDWFLFHYRRWIKRDHSRFLWYFVWDLLIPFHFFC